MLLKRYRNLRSDLIHKKNSSFCPSSLPVPSKSSPFHTEPVLRRPRECRPHGERGQGTEAHGRSRNLISGQFPNFPLSIRHCTCSRETELLIYELGQVLGLSTPRRPRLPSERPWDDPGRPHQSSQPHQPLDPPRRPSGPTARVPGKGPRNPAATGLASASFYGT